MRNMKFYYVCCIKHCRNAESVSRCVTFMRIRYAGCRTSGPTAVWTPPNTSAPSSTGCATGTSRACGGSPGGWRETVCARSSGQSRTSWRHVTSSAPRTVLWRRSPTGRTPTVIAASLWTGLGHVSSWCPRISLRAVPSAPPSPRCRRASDVETCIRTALDLGRRVTCWSRTSGARARCTLSWDTRNDRSTALTPAATPSHTCKLILSTRTQNTTIQKNKAQTYKINLKKNI